MSVYALLIFLSHVKQKMAGHGIATVCLHLHGNSSACVWIKILHYSLQLKTLCSLLKFIFLTDVFLLLSASPFIMSKKGIFTYGKVNIKEKCIKKFDFIYLSG